MEYSANPKVPVVSPVGRPKVAPRNESKRFRALFSERKAVLVGGDILMVFLAVQAAFAMWALLDRARFDSNQQTTFWFWFPLLTGLWMGLSWLNDLYDVPSSADRMRSAGRVAIVATIVFIIYMAAFFVAPREALPRAFFVSFLAVNSVGSLLWRLAYAAWQSNSPLEHRVLIVGSGAMARRMASVLRQSPHVNYNVLGFVSTDVPQREREVGGGGRPVAAQLFDGVPVIGGQEDLGYFVNHLHAHEVVVAMENHLDRTIFQAMVECQAWGVKVSYMPDLYEKLRHSVPVEYIDPAWALHAIQDRPVFDRVQLAFKRMLDLVLVGVGLLFLLPLFPLVALAIRLDSRGSIFYRQVRCGRAGQPFHILKFRTMSTDAERDGQARWATRGDARITRVGRFLRKTRIDELPQLLNVLRGEMSFVGPRPERPEFVASLQNEVPFYYTRLMVKPGITGWAQIHYDYGNTIEDALIKLQYDFYYLRYWSVWLDLYTIFQTFKVVLKFKGI